MITTKLKPALSTSRRALLAAAAVVALATPSQAQTYPSQNITLDRKSVV